MCVCVNVDELVYLACALSVYLQTREITGTVRKEAIRLLEVCAQTCLLVPYYLDLQPVGISDNMIILYPLAIVR